MVYCEARLAALSGSLLMLQGKFDHELELPAPDAERLAEFKRKMYRIKGEIDHQQIKLVAGDVTASA